MIVVDTVVLAHFLLQSEQTDDVVALYRHDDHWVAPVLWKSELLNVLVKHIRVNELPISSAISLFQLADDMVDSRVTDSLATEILSLAVSSGCSTYDCHFIAHANRLQRPCITYDKKLLKAFPGIAVQPDAFIANV